MRSAFLLISLCLFASLAFATKETMMSQLSKFASSKFGKTIIETIEVEMMTSEDPRPILLQFLEELRTANIESQKAEDESIASTREYCTGSTDELNTGIKLAEDSITRDQKEIDELRPVIQGHKDQLTAEEETLKNFETQLDTATKNRNSNFELYTKNANRFARILAVLREVRSQIQNRADTRYESGSFLQKTGTTFMAQIKEKISALNELKGWGKMLNFLAAKVETHLTQTPDEVSDSGLKEIVRIIDSLISKFVEEDKANEDWNTNDLNSYNTLKGDLDFKIAQSKSNVSNLKNLILINENRIIELEGNIRSANDEITTKKQELDLVKESCDASEKSYEEGTKNRTAELAIIDEVIRIIKEELTNRRQFTEDTINKTVIPDWEDEQKDDGYWGLEAEARAAKERLNSS